MRIVDPYGLVPLNSQVTRRQKRWLRQEMLRLDVRSVSEVVRRLIAAEMVEPRGGTRATP